MGKKRRGLSIPHRAGQNRDGILRVSPWDEAEAEPRRWNLGEIPGVVVVLGEIQTEFYEA